MAQKKALDYSPLAQDFFKPIGHFKLQQGVLGVFDNYMAFCALERSCQQAGSVKILSFKIALTAHFICLSILLNLP